MATELFIQKRNQLERFVYTHVAKPFFFKRDPELVHDQIGSMGAALGKNVIGRNVTRAFFGYTHPMLVQKITGIDFANPVGLAAGFDKNARLIGILPEVGFGWMEIGSVTARPCAGNPKPRLFRLPESGALVVNYGLMNDGCDAISSRIAEDEFMLPVGTSLAPTNDAKTMDYKEAIADYLYSYEKFAYIGAYTTLNLSCPNTCNDQPFTDPTKLKELLDAVAKVPTNKPLFLKLSPDLPFAKLDQLLAVAKAGGVTGVICSNLTKNRNNSAIKEKVLPEKGGISGHVVSELSDKMIAHVARQWGKSFTIVGCGGVFTAEDAYRKIRLGASLIQMVTGMIYEGPQVVSSINCGLVTLLHRDGFSSIQDAVGVDL